jgi:hypothetical protein
MLHEKIGDDEPLSTLNIRFKEGIDLSDKEGQIIQVSLTSRNTSVPTIVTSSGSPAKAQGTDGMFVVCSNSCGMNKVLLKEKDQFELN